MESATEDDAARGRGEDKSNKETDGNFECNICLDVAKDAVVSLCGHLFW